MKSWRVKVLVRPSLVGGASGQLLVIKHQKVNFGCIVAHSPGSLLPKGFSISV